MSDFKAICDAIRGRDVITLKYSGATRTVEPHVVGYDGDGELTLRAWQLTGTGTGWRDFHVSNVSGVAPTGDTFAGPRPDYAPVADTISMIVCRL